jgi:hypothetical protein
MSEPACGGERLAIDTGRTRRQHQNQSNTINNGRNNRKAGQPTPGKALAIRIKIFAVQRHTVCELAFAARR